jgi:hypothetical protein
VTDTCTGCQQTLDLTQPHVKLVRQVERERASSVFVDDAAVVGQWHIEHAPGQNANLPPSGVGDLAAPTTEDVGPASDPHDEFCDGSCQAGAPLCPRELPRG